MSQNDTTPIVSELVKDDEAFADLVEEFVEGLADRVSGMNTAMQEANFDNLKHLAHQLKGAGGGHGYPQLTEISSRLEQSAVESRLDECQQSLSELQTLISRVVVQ